MNRRGERKRERETVHFSTTILLYKIFTKKTFFKNDRDVNTIERKFDHAIIQLRIWYEKYNRT